MYNRYLYRNKYRFAGNCAFDQVNNLYLGHATVIPRTVLVISSVKTRLTSCHLERSIFEGHNKIYNGIFDLDTV